MHQYWYIIISYSPRCTLRFTLRVVHSVGFDKCLMSCIYHYSFTQDSFTALKKSHFPSVHLSLLPPNSWCFTVSIVLPLPECHIVEIVQCVAFSDWLLSLSNMHVSFLLVFYWLDSSFYLIAEYYSTVWLYHTLLIHKAYRFIYLFFKIHLYWSIIASQCCVSLCCTAKWISHMHTYIPISPPS